MPSFKYITNIFKQTYNDYKVVTENGKNVSIKLIDIS